MSQAKFLKAYSILINEGVSELTKRAFKHALYRAGLYKGKKSFSGWGMTTTLTLPPWHAGDGGRDQVSENFLSAHHSLISMIINGQFCITQFGGDPHNPDTNREFIIKQLGELMWRHYIIFWSSMYALKNPQNTHNYVECGVCDGMGAYFAMSACKNMSMKDFKFFMYDAWSGMREDLLLPSEKGAIGSYSYLNLDNTKKNLAKFHEHTIFNQGFIPDSFEQSKNPQALVWMHIDLNSATPTIDALEFFFSKMPKGSVILFDDYAWNGYQDTKKLVDQWLKDKSGIMLAIPTGQSIFFKH